MKRTLTILAILFIVHCTVDGQQSPSYTQYTMNKFIFNPASAGMDGFTSVNLIAREQWVNFSGTPKTHAISIDSRILGDSYILKKLSVRKNKPEKTRSGNTAWGGYLYNDNTGLLSNTGINGTYAYHIAMGDAQLSFGLALLFTQLKFKSNEFITYNDEVIDPLLLNNSIWITDANFGMYYASETYYAGYSSLQILNSSAQFSKEGNGEYKLKRQHMLLGGFRYYASNRIRIEPSVLLKFPEDFRVQADFTVKGTYDGLYWVGVNVRTGTALSFFGGINYDRYYFGYAFDYNFGAIKNTFGTHEIMIAVRIGDSARRYKWLNSY